MKLLSTIPILDLCLLCWAWGADAPKTKAWMATEPVFYFEISPTKEPYLVQLNDDLVKGEWVTITNVQAKVENHRFKLVLPSDYPKQLFYRLQYPAYIYPEKKGGNLITGGSTNAPPPIPAS